VYNMIRTADYLYRWTGNPHYADYIERNLYNGILAQQNPETGMVAYFLPMAAGSRKGGEGGWSNPTMDFWCCLGTLVQAQTRYAQYIYYEDNDGLVVSQYIPSELRWRKDSVKVDVRQDFASHEYNTDFAGNRWNMTFTITTDSPVQFALQFRLPWWLRKKAMITVNGKREPVDVVTGSYTIRRVWHNDRISVNFPSEVYAEPLPDAMNLVAFMEGPIVLAGMCDKEITIQGDGRKPEDLLMPEYEHEYKLESWKQSHYRTVQQEKNIEFIPLYEVVDQRYTIYFPIGQ